MSTIDLGPRKPGHCTQQPGVRIFEGAYAEAARELRSFSEPQWPARVRMMALSRRALLEALTACEDVVELAAGTYTELSTERLGPYLDAWVYGRHSGIALPPWEATMAVGAA